MGASGNTYIGTGASKFEIPGNPVITGNPIISPSPITTFTLEYTDALAARPCGALLTDADGRIRHQVSAIIQVQVEDQAAGGT